MKMDYAEEDVQKNVGMKVSSTTTRMSSEGKGKMIALLVHCYAVIEITDSLAEEMDGLSLEGLAIKATSEGLSEQIESWYTSTYNHDIKKEMITELLTNMSAKTDRFLREELIKFINKEERNRNGKKRK